MIVVFRSSALVKIPKEGKKMIQENEIKKQMDGLKAQELKLIRFELLREMSREARLMTLEEASPILGISTRTLYGYARTRKIDAKKIAGRWRLSQKALEDFVDSASRE